jgi:hypothetical protein
MTQDEAATMFRWIKLAGIAAVLAAISLSGCGRAKSAASYVPDENVARRALTMALTAWQEGNSKQLSLDDKTRVEVVDQHRRPGQALEEFKILGEVAGDGGRWFEVELKLDHPEQTEQVRYIVVGIDPLWVFRQPDYEMLGHWDHPMPADASEEVEDTPASDDGGAQL